MSIDFSSLASSSPSVSNLNGLTGSSTNPTQSLANALGSLISAAQSGNPQAQQALKQLESQLQQSGNPQAQTLASQLAQLASPTSQPQSAASLAQQLGPLLSQLLAQAKAASQPSQSAYNPGFTQNSTYQSPTASPVSGIGSATPAAPHWGRHGRHGGGGSVNASALANSVTPSSGAVPAIQFLQQSRQPLAA
jgi:hypothetical protein